MIYRKQVEPLRLLKELEKGKVFPDFAYLRSLCKKKSLLDLCDSVTSTVRGISTFREELALRADLSLAYQLINWSKAKQVYVFDPEFLDELVGTWGEREGNFPTSVLLNNLPCDCFYVDNSYSLPEVGDVVAGYLFSVYKGEFPSNSDTMLAISCLHPEDMYRRTGRSNTTVQLCFNSANVEDLACCDLLTNFHYYGEEFWRDIIYDFFNILMYICSSNRDERAVSLEVPKEDYSALGVKHNKKRQVVQKRYLGEKTMSIIREDRKRATVKVSAKGTGKGTAKRPHLRKGHFHTFWVGKRGTDERKQVVKFVLPTFIHKEDSDSAVPTIRVKGEVKK